MRFTKMHGTLNDYIYINCFLEQVTDPKALAIAMSRPHAGIGADGLILILPSEKADFRMRIFNADGSEAEMCGNGARCVAKYVHAYGLTDRTHFTLETGAGVKRIWLDVHEGDVRAVTIDMGAPSFAPEAVPVLLPGERILSVPIEVAGSLFEVTALSMGNPHAVVFLKEDPFAWPDFERVGPALSLHPLFSNHTNAEFIQVQTPSRLRMRVWERGSGETLACGTGACAALVAAHMAGLAERSAEVELRGGCLHIDWRAEDGHVYMTGPATIVFDGEWHGEKQL